MRRSSNDALTQPPRPGRVAVGLGIAIAIVALIVSLLLAILSADQGVSSGPVIDIGHLVRMTSIQAGLSTILSLAVGMALAWALNRLRFPGRDLIVALFASAIVTPGMIVAFGLLAVWGRAGWINDGLALFGLSIGNPIFGLGGIVAAHTILDGAFAARILLARLDAIPDTRLKLGQSLGLSSARRFAVIDWPAMRGALPGLAAIIFLLAFTSFPIVLMLGGGPANQTLEVAIYSAVRLDFDLTGAVQLAAIQIAICGTIVVATSALSPVPTVPGQSAGRLWRDKGSAVAAQWAVLALSILGFGLPLLAVLVGGFKPDILAILVRPDLIAAITSSLVIGTASALLTLLLALGVSLGRAAAGRGIATAIGAPSYAYLAVPAVVLSLGFFIATLRLGWDTEAVAPYVVIVANALLSLPFAVATLGPPLLAVSREHGRLIRSLGLGGGNQFRRVELPLIGREIGVVLALAFCFSLGDLGVIALFGTGEFTTLPLLMYRALGAYRGNDASVIAAIMLALTILAFALLPKLAERLLHARS